MRAELKRLTERAADEGLLDVAYTSTDSPFGELLLVVAHRPQPRGLMRVARMVGPSGVVEQAAGHSLPSHIRILKCRDLTSAAAAAFNR